MTTEKSAWLCKQGVAHQLIYRGKTLGYRCILCGFSSSKEDLKGATDNA